MDMFDVTVVYRIESEHALTAVEAGRRIAQLDSGWSVWTEDKATGAMTRHPVHGYVAVGAAPADLDAEILGRPDTGDPDEAPEPPEDDEPVEAEEAAEAAAVKILADHAEPITVLA